VGVVAEVRRLVGVRVIVGLPAVLVRASVPVRLTTVQVHAASLPSHRPVAPRTAPRRPDTRPASSQPTVRRAESRSSPACCSTNGSDRSVPGSYTSCQSSSSRPGRRRPTTRTPPAGESV
jgi:hypothetical protein